MKTIPGINIQYPWSSLILSGKKTIETRSYKIPEKFVGMPMAIIETPGKFKKEIPKARVIGIIIFSGSKRYKSKKAWVEDYDQHLVSSKDPDFQWNIEKEKWGWEIDTVHKLEKPVPAPKKRGMVFATKCRVPSF